MAFVYVFQSGSTNFFKIGRTKGDIEKRRKDLSTGNPEPLKLFDHIETDHDSLVEKYLHTKFFDQISKASDATEYFEIEPSVLQKGLEDARTFLDEYIPLHEQANELKEVESNDEIKTPDDESISLYKKLCALRGEMDGLKFEYEVLENRLKNKIGRAEAIDGVATWKTQVRMALDQKALKEKHPEIVEEFITEKKSRVFKLS